jgi:guanylate kinase
MAELVGVERIIQHNLGDVPKLLIVMAGPSGVGKYTITRRILENHPTEMYRVRTYTTRKPREGEVEGEQYHFVSREEFRRLSEEGKLLEPHGQDVYGQGDLYSMPADPLQAPPDAHLILAEVDIHGTALLKRLFPDICVSIFVTAPPDELLERIRGRDAEMDADDLAHRLVTAREQMRASKDFDYLVVNREDRLEHTVQVVEAIITAERHRVRPGADLEAALPSDAFDALPSA